MSLPKTSGWSLLIIIGCSLTLAFHISRNSNFQNTKQYLDQEVERFRKATQDLQEKSELYKYNQLSFTELRNSLDSARLRYKRVEVVLDYYYPGFVEEHINGAPLLQIERHSTRPFVIPPQGLQVLDELIYSDNPEAEKLEIAKLSRELFTQTNALSGGFYQRQIKQYEIIEASRMELVRLFTLGLTGFDTPGSLNAIAEAQTVLLSLKQLLQISLTESKDLNQLIQKFEAAITYLESAEDFNSLNRLEFLRKHWQALYSGLYQLQEFYGEHPSSQKVTSWNPKSQHLFSDEFLNPYFFTELKATEDSPELHQLGKKLFYDTRISKNGKLSCASCHKPEKAFTDGKRQSASNVMGKSVLRNAPTLLNAVYADRYFYDLRAFSLEQQAEHVIFNHEEFNTAYAEIADKLRQDPQYPGLFKKAYGSLNIQREGISRALASYLLNLRSFNSPFDRYARGETETIDPKVEQGFNLFMGKAGCGTCHFAPTFSGLVPPFYTKNETEILGVLKSPTGLKKVLDDDMGRYANTLYSEQAWIYERSFKTTTVRNVALTAPYFHNGAYSTLEQVVDFYDHGGGAGLGLEVKNQTLPPDSLHLQNHEKQALIAFMQSLTDNQPVDY